MGQREKRNNNREKRKITYTLFRTLPNMNFWVLIPAFSRKILPLDSESVSFDNRADEIGRKVIRTT